MHHTDTLICLLFSSRSVYSCGIQRFAKHSLTRLIVFICSARAPQRTINLFETHTTQHANAHTRARAHTHLGIRCSLLCSSSILCSSLLSRGWLRRRQYATVSRYGRVCVCVCAGRSSRSSVKILVAAPEGAPAAEEEAAAAPSSCRACECRHPDRNLFRLAATGCLRARR